MLNYRLCVNDPILNHDQTRYGLFIRGDRRKLQQSVFFVSLEELIVYLDIRNLKKSNFKVIRKYNQKGFSRFVMEYQYENESTGSCTS